MASGVFLLATCFSDNVYIMAKWSRFMIIPKKGHTLRSTAKYRAALWVEISNKMAGPGVVSLMSALTFLIRIQAQMTFPKV